MLERLLSGVRPEMRARTSALFITLAWVGFVGGLLGSVFVGVGILLVGFVVLRSLAKGPWAAPKGPEELRPVAPDQGIGVEADGSMLDLQARVEARLKAMGPAAEADRTEP